jgi:hypothetical protein
MADVPVMTIMNEMKNPSKNDKFGEANRKDILATLKFLNGRGMLSDFHFKHWTDMANECKDAELLHLWWDSITSGAM